ncbi:MAG: DMT family transporter [Candidatus Acidiferrales bacterium]
MSHASHPSRALLFALIGAMMLIWGVNFIIAKITLRYVDPITLASFRVVLSALLILPVYFLLPRRKTAFSRADMWEFVKLGFFGVAINQMCFTIGIHYTTVSHSSLIVGMGPIYVLLLAWLQRLESMTAQKLTGMVMAFTGVVVLAGEHGFSLEGGSLTGDLITLAGSWGFAFYVVLGKRVAPRFDSVEMNTFNYLTGAVLILPVAVRQALELDWRAVAWQGWAGLLFMAAFASVIAYLIYFWALKHVAASRLAAFSYLLPLIATLLSIAFLGEPVTGYLLIGGALVMGGVYLAEIGFGTEAEPDDEEPDTDVH